MHMENYLVFSVVGFAFFYTLRYLIRSLTVGEQQSKCANCSLNRVTIKAKKIDRF